MKNVIIRCGITDNYSGSFKICMTQIFEHLSDFVGGGFMCDGQGRFKGNNDKFAKCMDFYMEEDKLVEFIQQTEDIFNKIRPMSVEFVSVKVYDVETRSFRIGDNNE